jgi:hypothetical protein
MYLTFTLGKDRRGLVDDITDFKIETQDMQKVQGRQGDSLANQVFVTIKNQDGTPYNLTGCNMIFEGKLPDNVHKIYDAKHGVILNAQNGQFRFDLPKPAFAVAGSYVQAFFRIMRNGDSVALLEFDLTVLADLVITDEIPRNYLTPFEDKFTELSDLIEKGGKDFEAAMAQWKADFTKLVVEMTSTTDGINLTISEIKAQLGTLEGKIKADGLLTQADFDAQIKIVNETINNALAELKQPVPVDSSIIIGGPISADEKNALDKLRSTVDTSKFNLLFLNDPHYGMQSDLMDYGPRYGINHLNTALYMDDLVDVIVSGGDNIDGHLNSIAGLVNDEQNYALELIYGSPNHSDKFALRGNHDDGTLRLRNYRLGIQTSPDYFPDTIPEEQFKQHYMTGNLLFNEHRNNGDSLYFYKDYPDKKVRLIGLNSNDTPEDVKDSDGGVKYIGISNMGYRQEQLDWLANVALQNVPEDYATIVVVHAQATPTENDDTDLSDGMKDHHTNQKQVVQILNDFKNGQSSVVTNNVKDWEVNVKTNFVTQGKRDLVAWIHGHLHYEESTTSNGFNDISCISSIPVTGFNQGSKNGGWSLFTLDRDNRRLNITGYGMATNRSFSY